MRCSDLRWISWTSLSNVAYRSSLSIRPPLTLGTLRNWPNFARFRTVTSEFWINANMGGGGERGEKRRVDPERLLRILGYLWQATVWRTLESAEGATARVRGWFVSPAGRNQ